MKRMGEWGLGDHEDYKILRVKSRDIKSKRTKLFDFKLKQ